MVFSHPTIGTVGLTEKAATAKYGAENIKVYTSTFTNLWYGPWQMEPDDKPKTAMKLVTLLPSERVVGLHCIGEMPHCLCSTIHHMELLDLFSYVRLYYFIFRSRFESLLSSTTFFTSLIPQDLGQTSFYKGLLLL